MLLADVAQFSEVFERAFFAMNAHGKSSSM
jgi:hypothetical protein